MPMFSVLILTAAPAGQSAESGGAYAKIEGRESLLRAVELFLNRDTIKQLQFVVAPEAADEAKRKYGANLAFTGVKLVVGGPRWIDQIAAGAASLAPETTHVVIHDAARPAVPYTDIDALLAAAEKHDAVVLASHIRSSLLELDEGGNVVASHLPQHFVQLQTPQIFSLKTLNEMVAAGREPHASQLTVVKGSPLNVRLGAAGEAGFAKAMIAMLPKPKMRAASSPFEEAQW